MDQQAIHAFAGAIAGITVQPIDLSEPFLDLAARFAGEPGAVILLSGGDLDCARHHILAVRPWLRLTARRRNCLLAAGDRELQLAADPFDVLRKVMQAYETAREDRFLPVAAGLFGYFSYDLKDIVEILPRTALDDLELPDLCLYAPSIMVVQDVVDGKTWLCVVHRGPEDPAARRRELAGAMALLLPPRPGKPPGKGFVVGKTGLRSSFERSEYLAAVKKTKDYINAGDIYQVNLSQRFETDFSGDAYALFRSLFDVAPGPFYAFVNAGDHCIVSTSPERFLQRNGSLVETRPIKGTRPRGKTKAQDQAFREDLLNSPKDDAELSMIVDLMRNDLGRVCAGGSVRVAAHRRLEAYHNVFHLVSVVVGDLAEGKDTIDLLRATFPGGSITGCPRIRAMEIIDELEPVRRHVYTGAIGYLSFHDTLDLSIAIRTATVVGNRMVFSVGGGVVFDSDPADEFAETLHKAKSLMGVLAAKKRKAAPASGKKVWMNGRILPEEAAGVPLGSFGVQYGLGFFETIRVEKGRPFFLDDHLRRFYRAWETLLEASLPDLTWEAVIDQVIRANSLENQTAAVKIMALAGEPGEDARLPILAATARACPPRPAIVDAGGLRLATYPHPRQTPLADHKTLNYAYYYLAGKWAAAQGADEALILNPDGSISETNTANILLIFGKKLVSPASPHVLPGIMEARIIQKLIGEGYQAQTRKIMPDAVFSADQVILTNSLIGVVPVLSLDGNIIHEKIPARVLDPGRSAGYKNRIDWK